MFPEMAAQGYRLAPGEWPLQDADSQPDERDVAATRTEPELRPTPNGCEHKQPSIRGLAAESPLILMAIYN